MLFVVVRYGIYDDYNKDGRTIADIEDAASVT